MDELTREVRMNKWAEIILAANSSGLTRAEFCKQNGLSTKTFYNYQRKLRKELYEASLQTGNNTLVEIPISKPVERVLDATAIIHANGITIEIREGISETTLMNIGRMVRNAL